MLNVSNHFASDIFNLFIEFFENCVVYFVRLANSNTLNRILKKLFKLIDTTNVKSTLLLCQFNIKLKIVIIF